jgi:hypothetical protein
MGRALDAATEGPRFALAVTTGALLAVLSPLVLLTAGEASATVGLAVVTLVLAALARLGENGALLSARVAVAGPPTRDEAPPVLAGRVTDRVHHPLRPRAPGPA